MPIRIIIPPRTHPVTEIPRCPIDGAPYDDEGVPTCSFLHGRTVVTVIGGDQ